MAYRRIGIILIILTLCISAYAGSTKIEDASKSGYKANVDKVGSKYGIVTYGGEGAFQVQIDYDGGTNPIYVGFSTPGAAGTDTTWKIMKLTWDGNDNPTEMQFADQTSAFTKAWDSRAGYDYTP